MTGEYRYERKFRVKGYNQRALIAVVKSQPCMFREIFYERQINNIYFDDFSFTSFYENTEGDQFRTKRRIRWYGDVHGYVEKPVLEFKIKKGLMGTKAHYKLKPFDSKPGMDLGLFRGLVEDSDMPKHQIDSSMKFKPVLINHYKRRYFMTPDKRFRLTIDSELTYYFLNNAKFQFMNREIEPEANIIELKYDSSDDADAKKISALFPFRMTKNSKFLTGVGGGIM